MTNYSGATDKQRFYLEKHILDDMDNRNAPKSFSDWWVENINKNREESEKKISQMDIHNATHLIGMIIKGDFTAVIGFWNSI